MFLRIMVCTNASASAASSSRLAQGTVPPVSTTEVGPDSIRNPIVGVTGP